jgi:hypothetical protein
MTFLPLLEAARTPGVVAPCGLFWLVFKANCRLARIVNDYLIGRDFPCPFTGWAYIALIARANSDTGWTLLHLENSHNQA